MSGSQAVAPAAADLAEVPAFGIGGITVDPASRELRGPLGEATLEPRLMTLLIALHAAAGEVVTRDRLAKIGWKGRFVADDSLNGAMAALRKALRTSGEGAVIETVPKTGYRLLAAAGHDDFAGGDAEPAAKASEPLAQPASERRTDRRALLVGGGALGLVAAGVAAWRWRPSQPRDPQVEELLRRGTTDLHVSYPDPKRQGVASLSEAVRLAPDDAKAWGMLALAWRAAGEFESQDRKSTAYGNAEAAALRAVALDPRQGDALTALALLQPMFGDWAAAEARYRKALEADPGNPFALGALGTFQMSTGQARASEATNAAIVERFPFSANRVFRLVLAHWNTGHARDADLLAMRAMQQWPDHPAVWFSRFWTLAFSEREQAALAMLADEKTRPALPPPFANLLTTTLRAIGPDPALRPAAIAANRAFARAGPQPATAVIMLLSALGDPEGALEVARGFILQKGNVVVRQSLGEDQLSVNDQHSVTTMMLWTPPCAPLRALPGFADLCRGIELTDYWRTSGNKPDFAISGQRL